MNTDPDDTDERNGEEPARLLGDDGNLPVATLGGHPAVGAGNEPVPLVVDVEGRVVGEQAVATAVAAAVNEARDAGYRPVSVVGVESAPDANNVRLGAVGARSGGGQ